MEEKKDKNGQDQKPGEAGDLGLKEIKEMLDKCQKEREEYLAGWQRAKADLINYKKDEARKFEEIAKYLSEDIIIDLITVLDHFDLGIAALEKAGKAEKGVYMIRAELADILKKRGLSEILVKIGDKYDPKLAEAVAEVESNHPVGVVIEEIAKGYRLHDKVLRPAKVKISKGQKTDI